ncbi:MAG: hypothetical protein ABIN25_05890, partial [Ginsengibacter sp.]
FVYGKYIFGSLSGSFSAATGKIFLARPTASGLWGFEDIQLKSFPVNLGQFLKGFGQDEEGEVYAVTSSQIGPQGNTGKVYKLVFTK